MDFLIENEYGSYSSSQYYFFCVQESFARAKNWVKELQRQASPNIVIALSGNKADLANKRAVDFQVRENKWSLGSQSFLLDLLWILHIVWTK